MSSPEFPRSEGPSGNVPPGNSAPQEEKPNLGVLQRLTGCIISPGETFADINRKPTWIVPVLIIVVVALASFALLQWKVKPDWNQIIRQQITARAQSSGQNLTEEQIQQQVRIGSTFAKYTPVVIIVFTPIVYLALAGIFALALLLMQAQTTFRKIFSVVTWSACVTSLMGAIVTVLALFLKQDVESIDLTKPESISVTNLGGLMPSDMSAPLKALGASFDVFTIWLLILLAIGFAAVSGKRSMTTGKSASVVFGLWVLWVIGKVGWAAAFGR